MGVGGAGFGGETYDGHPLVADLHVHTVASGHAFSTVEEIARAAAAKGMELVALTDHGPGLPGGAHNYHFWNLRVVPREMYGVRLLKGVEANIMDADGSLDLSEELLDLMDIVLVSFHPRLGFDSDSEEANTAAMVGAIANQYVDIVAHPGNPSFPLNMEVVVDAAREHGVLLEINNSSFLEVTSRSGAYEHDLSMARLAGERGMDLAMGSDAHMAYAVGEFGHASGLAREAGLPAERIINTSAARVVDFLRGRGKKV